MSTSRRNFIKAGVLAALFAAWPFKSALGQAIKDRDGNPGPSDAQGDPLSTYSKATFKYYLNSIFQLQAVSGVVQVTLMQIDDLPAPKNGECFSLLFRGGSKALQQDTYTVVHSALGRFQLFLVPAGVDDNGVRAYIATINRLSPADAASMAPPTRTGSTQKTVTTPPAPVATPAPVMTPAPTSPSPTPPTGPTKKPARRPSRKPLPDQGLDLEFDPEEL